MKADSSWLTMASRGISLYRSILRAHRKHLPPEMQQLGNAYLRSEFKSHKSAKSEHLEGFFTEWEKYLDQILMTARAQVSVSAGTLDDTSTQGRRSVFQYGKDLPHDVELSADQMAQLEKLREETSKAGRPSREK